MNPYAVNYVIFCLKAPMYWVVCFLKIIIEKCTLKQSIAITLLVLTLKSIKISLC